MARKFAKMGTDLWAEQSIRALKVVEQRAYLLAYTQPELSRCGVLPYTLRRWTNLSVDDSLPKLRRAFAGLTNRRHVVIDEDSEELLIRTYVIHDGLLTQPNVVVAMCDDFQQITSRYIRGAFLTEMRRLWDLPLDDKERAGWLTAMRGTPTLTETRDKGLAEPLREAIAEGIAKPFTEPIPEPFRLAREGARAPSPSPSPSPSPTTSSGPVPNGSPDRAGVKTTLTQPTYTDEDYHAGF